MTIDRSIRRRMTASLLACMCVAACAQPQAPSPSEPVHRPPTPAQPTPAPPAADAGPVAPLAWLAGCWKGSVNQRDYREQWLPFEGGMLIGAGQQVMRGKMQDYEFLRIEARFDGVVFSQFGADRKEAAFRLENTTTDGNDTIFTFANMARTFPARLSYRRGADGWLYETIEGGLQGGDKKVIYPLRRVDCETGDLITH
ncbi:MAG TPA: DUF6265 family protein [Casimicrobiaceae bacterium]|jgi:hypothetical protein|nr:DUF6265 family protein [Casimicrobiaceae bacterium]